MRRVKEAEADAMARALGWEVPVRAEERNANLTALGGSKGVARAVQESVKEDVEQVGESKGIGFGGYSGATRAEEDEEIMAGSRDQAAGGIMGGTEVQRKIRDERRDKAGGVWGGTTGETRPLESETSAGPAGASAARGAAEKVGIVIDRERQSDGAITGRAVARAEDVTTTTGRLEAAVGAASATVVTSIVPSLTGEDMPRGAVMREDPEADHRGRAGIETSAEEKETGATAEGVWTLTHRPRLQHPY